MFSALALMAKAVVKDGMPTSVPGNKHQRAGGFTLPVLTPKLTELVNEASDVAIRMAPFLTAGLVAMQTMERGNITALTRQMPMIADELRRQADNFIELEELSSLIARQHAGPRPQSSHSHHSAAPVAANETSEADAS